MFLTYCKQKTVVKDEYQLVRVCLSGHIFYSTPADFTSDVGTRLFLHPSTLKMSHPPIIVTWIANGIASFLDALFLTKVELQRAEYCQTLYSTVAMGASYLILCSETDDLAPYQTIFNFSQRLQSLGADVKLIKWSSSPHVGHYLHHPEEYKSAVGELLIKAASIYDTRLQQLKSKNNGIGLAHINMDRLLMSFICEVDGPLLLNSDSSVEGKIREWESLPPAEKTARQLDLIDVKVLSQNLEHVNQGDMELQSLLAEEGHANDAPRIALIHYLLGVAFLTSTF